MSLLELLLLLLLLLRTRFLLFALRLGMSSLQFFVETQSDCQKLTASKAHSMTVVELARLDSYSGRAELKAQQVRSKSYSSSVSAW